MGARQTILSPCRTYRYVLWREIGGLFNSGSYAMFVCLNPSTADEREDDPTVRRCLNFARVWGYDALCIANLFAYRSKDITEMKKSVDPIGPDNDRMLASLGSGAGVVVAAWGTNGDFMDRDIKVSKMFSELHCLRMTKKGFPEHPLYLPGTLAPIPYRGRRVFK